MRPISCSNRDFIDLQFFTDAFYNHLFRGNLTVRQGIPYAGETVPILADIDFASIRQPLYTGGDVHGLTKIVEPVVESDHNGMSRMNADFQYQLIGDILVEGFDVTQHFQGGVHGIERGHKRRHDGVTDGLDGCPFIVIDRIAESVEMLADKEVCLGVADLVVQRGGAAEVGEEKG